MLFLLGRGGFGPSVGIPGASSILTNHHRPSHRYSFACQCCDAYIYTTAATCCSRRGNTLAISHSVPNPYPEYGSHGDANLGNRSLPAVASERKVDRG